MAVPLSPAAPGRFGIDLKMRPANLCARTAAIALWHRTGTLAGYVTEGQSTPRCLLA